MSSLEVRTPDHGLSATPWPPVLDPWTRLGVHGGNGSGKTLLALALGHPGLVPGLEIGTGEGIQLPDSAAVAVYSPDMLDRLMEEELRKNDSDFAEGGYDPGTRLGAWLAPVLNRPGLRGLAQSLALEPLWDQGLMSLSTGELRKAFLVRLWGEDRPVMVLDEALDGLDLRSRGILLAFLRDVAPGSRGLVWLSGRRDHFPPSLPPRVEISSQCEPSRQPRAEVDLPWDHERPRTLVRIPELPADDRGSLVRMEGVRVAWGERVVLDNFHWNLDPGEHTLIEGPNGSGKSTILGLVTGECPQVYANRVRILGTWRGQGESVWDIRRGLGWVGQKLHRDYRRLGSTSLMEVLLSGFHDSLGLYQAPGDLALRRSQAWWDFLGLRADPSHRFDSLGQGDQRLLLVARAMVKLPPLLLLDEPCHGLDDEARDLVLALVEEITRTTATTVVYVSHSPDEKLHCIKKTISLDH